MANGIAEDIEYKGTLPLDLNLFPEVDWIDSLGVEWTSNIKTRLEKLSIFTENPDDSTKWVLFPTFMGGEDLSKENVFDMILNQNKHFGIYDSMEEGDKVDKWIHEEGFQEESEGMLDKLINMFKGL